MLTLTNSDIIQTLEFLAGDVIKADNGTTDALISEELSENGDVNGYLLVFLSGNLIGQEAYIESTSETTYTLDTTLTDEITNKTKFAYLETGYQSFIQRASNIIEDLFRNKAMKLELFLNTAQLKELHIYKTIELICLSKRKGATDDDAYHSNYLAFKELFEESFSSLVADYDYDEDGNIDTDEELSNIGQVSFVR